MLKSDFSPKQRLKQLRSRDLFGTLAQHTLGWRWWGRGKEGSQSTVCYQVELEAAGGIVSPGGEGDPRDLYRGTVSHGRRSL